MPYTDNDSVLLVRDSDRGSNDYRLGDIVQAFPGTTELVLPPAPPFYLVIITGLPFDQAQQYMVEHCDADTREMIARRLWGIQPSDLPANVRNTLVAQRWIEFTWTAVRRYVKSKLGGTA